MMSWYAWHSWFSIFLFLFFSTAFAMHGTYCILPRFDSLYFYLILDPLYFLVLCLPIPSTTEILSSYFILRPDTGVSTFYATFRCTRIEFNSTLPFNPQRVELHYCTVLCFLVAFEVQCNARWHFVDQLRYMRLVLLV